MVIGLDRARSIAQQYSQPSLFSQMRSQWDQSCWEAVVWSAQHGRKRSAPIARRFMKLRDRQVG